MAKTTGDNTDRDDEDTVIDASKDGNDDADEGDEVEDDRGDDVEGKIDKKALAKVAGEDGKDDGGDEADGADDDEGEEGEGKDKPPKTVPYSRLSKVVSERDTLRDELAALKAKSTDDKGDKKEEETTAFDIDKKEEEYISLLSQGDDKAALAVRKEINTYLRESAKSEAVTEATQAMSQAEQAREFAKAVKETKKQYKWLDEESDEADEESIDMVVALRDRHIRNGKTAPEALKLAAKRVSELRATEEGDDEGDEGDDDKKKDDKDATRKKTAIERGVDANSRQPPNLSGKGDRSARNSQLDVESMSEEDFEKLPLAERKRLRGDAG